MKSEPFFFFLGLRFLVDTVTPTLTDEFQQLRDDFDATPKFRLDNDVKQEIVEAIDKAGWDFVGVDFFEFLGEC